jgi:DNA segregation ATPase FtsK/SpoIIIE-like protein
VQVGWFAEVARRHLEHSHEVRQATEIFEEHGQLFFGFAQSGGTAAELAFGQCDNASAPRNPVTAFVNTVRNSGASVTISAGEHSVRIDKDGVKPEPTKAILERAIAIVQRDGKITRSGLQRMLSVGYNAACAIADKIISPSDDPNMPGAYIAVAATAAA